MTEQTKRAIELTKEVFGNAEIIFEDEWNRKIRKPNFNPTLKTVAKYLGYKKIVEIQHWEDDWGDEWTTEYSYYRKEN